MVTKQISTQCTNQTATKQNPTIQLSKKSEAEADVNLPGTILTIIIHNKSSKTNKRKDKKNRGNLKPGQEMGSRKRSQTADLS